MKTVTLLLPLLTLCSGWCNAQQISPAPRGGYTGPGVTVTTVAAAKTSRDDSHVKLRGKISQHLGGDRYLFTDASGSVHVDIDEHVWRGQNISATDVLEIDGEIDKDWNSVEVDVDHLRKM